VKLFRNGWRLLKEAAEEWSNDKAPRLGAALSYYTIFSLAPVLLLVIAVAGLVLGAQAAQGKIVAQFGEGAAVFMRAAETDNHHDLGLFTIGAHAAGPEQGRAGLYHLAWEVDTLDELERVAEALTKADALVGSSDHGSTKSLYGRDPNGIEFEIVWLIPADLLDDDALEARREQLLGAGAAQPDDLLDAGHADAREAQGQGRRPRLDVDEGGGGAVSGGHNDLQGRAVARVTSSRQRRLAGVCGITRRS